MRNRLAKMVFWFHTAIVAFLLALILMPRSFWPEKTVFQFYLVLIIVIHQIIWGLILMPWTKRYRVVCVLTTITHILRGQQISNAGIYDRSWTKEVLGKTGITIPHRIATLFTFTVLAIASIQYFFFQ